jgi:ferrous iron transport protein A
MEEKGVRPLAEVPEGTQAVVQGLRGGGGFLGRMAALGFIVGGKVSVLQNSGRGPVIVLVRDTRVALGRGEALKVLVGTQADSHGDSRI